MDQNNGLFGSPFDNVKKIVKAKPRRLAKILATDRVAIIVTNRRARKGIKQDGFSR